MSGKAEQGEEGEKPAKSNGPGRIVSRFIIAVVRLYQSAISPLLKPRCRFLPTCSQYFIEAVEKRGPIRGIGLGVWRICRCHPFAKGGYDPVPGTEGK
jgi:putative membrane protein insertion efficiency factor